MAPDESLDKNGKVIRRHDTGAVIPRASLANLEKSPRYGKPPRSPGRPPEVKNAMDAVRRYCTRPASEIKWTRDLAEELGMVARDVQVIDVAMAALVMKASLSGKAEFMKILLDRILGPVTQKLEVESKSIKLIFRKYLPGSRAERTADEGTED